MMRKMILMGAGLCFLMQFCFAADTRQLTSHPVHKNTVAKRTVHTKKNKRSKHKQHAKKNHKPKPIPNDRRDLEAEHTSSFVGSLGHSIGEHLVNMVYKTVDTLRYSAYKLGGTRFDASNGVYIVDCSEYVDNLLQAAHPDAFYSLVDAAGSYKPTTQHYYQFFNDLSENDKSYWNKINDAKKLQPGDILVFRNKNRAHGVAGHIMVVMDKPVADTEGYLVRVADSAPVGHSEDTRQHRVSGIGIGTLLLKINPHTGQPSAYAWKVGSHWVKNVNFAMARPVGMLE